MVVLALFVGLVMLGWLCQVAPVIAEWLGLIDRRAVRVTQRPPDIQVAQHERR